MELQKEAKIESPTTHPGTLPPPRVNSSLLCFLRPNMYPNRIVPTVKIKKTIKSMIFIRSVELDFPIHYGKTIECLLDLVPLWLTKLVERRCHKIVFDDAKQ